MTMYAMVVFTKRYYNGLQRTHSLEFEVTEATKSFVRATKEICHIPIRLSKINEYRLCSGYECLYFFGRDKNKLLEIWEEMMTPTTRFLEMF